MLLEKRTKTYAVTATVWLFILLGALAYVFVATGCAPVGQTIEFVPGPKGDTGNTGATGSTGSQGPAGLPGAPGSPGLNATPVTVVDLCPGVTTYPGVFVEVALCLQGKLYGVYSANGGFLTYLAPGAYSSNAIGSACSLTVGPNCTVSH